MCLIAVSVVTMLTCVDSPLNDQLNHVYVDVVTWVMPEVCKGPDPFSASRLVFFFFSLSVSISLSPPVSLCLSRSRALSYSLYLSALVDLPDNVFAGCRLQCSITSDGAESQDTSLLNYNTINFLSSAR